MDLSGKIAVVTGAGRGIGAAIAATFGQAGADLVIADLNEASAREIADRIRQPGRKAAAVKADVSLPESVDGLFSAVQAEFGRVDILVNNAGIWFRKPFWEISDAEWDRVLAFELGPFEIRINAIALGPINTPVSSSAVSENRSFSPLSQRPVKEA